MTETEADSLRRGGISLTPTQRYIFEHYTYEFVTEPGARFEECEWKVSARIGGQTFTLDFLCKTHDEARWLRAMFSVAMDKMATEILSREITE